MDGSSLIQRSFSVIGGLVKVATGTLVLLVLGHYAIGGVQWVLGGKAPAIDRRVDSPVYAGFPERAEFWIEHVRASEARFEPYYHWRRNGFAGRYTNVSPEGVRTTARPTPVEPGAGKVFVFGGSTIWGTGSPDDKTIPSLLQSMLGGRYDVYNFGETAYVSAQELNYLLYQLARGNRPDVVIFYDGVNDGYAGAYSPAVPRDPQNLREEERQRRLEKRPLDVLRGLLRASNYGRLIDYVRGMAGTEGPSYQEWDAQVSPSIQKNSEEVIRLYEEHIRQVRALAREYGFKAFFFWQPNLFSLSRNTNSYERTLIESASPILVESQQAVYQVAKRRLSNREGEGIFFLGNVFDSTDDPIYIDWMHVGPNGNERIAREIFQRLQGGL